MDIYKHDSIHSVHSVHSGDRHGNSNAVPVPGIPPPTAATLDIIISAANTAYVAEVDLVCEDQ